MFARLAAFLELEPSLTWLNDAVEGMRISGEYDHDERLVKYYRQSVRERFADLPELASGLLAFF